MIAEWRLMPSWRCLLARRSVSSTSSIKNVPPWSLFDLMATLPVVPNSREEREDQQKSEEAEDPIQWV